MENLSPVIIWLIIINILGFLLMAADKSRSVRRGYRTPEAILFFISLLGGTPGTFLAMHLCHHKSLKARFYIGLPLILFLQIILLIIFFLKY